MRQRDNGLTPGPPDSRSARWPAPRASQLQSLPSGLRHPPAGRRTSVYHVAHGRLHWWRVPSTLAAGVRPARLLIGGTPRAMSRRPAERLTAPRNPRELPCRLDFGCRCRLRGALSHCPARPQGRRTPESASALVCQSAMSCAHTPRGTTRPCGNALRATHSRTCSSARWSVTARLMTGSFRGRCQRTSSPAVLLQRR
jgi:hypothetical protein